MDELTLLDVLLTVLTRDDFKSIPNNDDIKIALEQILSTHKPTRGRSFKFSALYWKFFDILTKKTASNRKKRASGAYHVVSRNLMQKDSKEASV